MQAATTYRHVLTESTAIEPRLQAPLHSHHKFTRHLHIKLPHVGFTKPKIRERQTKNFPHQKKQPTPTAKTTQALTDLLYFKKAFHIERYQSSSSKHTTVQSTHSHTLTTSNSNHKHTFIQKSHTHACITTNINIQVRQHLMHQFTPPRKTNPSHTLQPQKQPKNDQ